MKILPTTLARLLFAMTAGSLCLPVASRAQTAPPAPTPKVEDVQKMTPFEVSDKKSKGAYVQEDVTSVTKFAVALIDVPQNIFVFNRAMLDDLNTGFVRHSLTYNASLQGGLWTSGGSYRGFSNQEKLTDGFKTSAFFDYDSIHYERAELLKGPSAVMYGRTEPGGITVYTTKKPIPGATFATFNLGTGKINGNTRKSYTMDVNDSFGAPGESPLNVRVTAATREYMDTRDSATANGAQNQSSARIAASYWLTNSTRLYASYLYAKQNFESQFGRYASFAVTVPQATPGASIPFSLLYGRDPLEDYGYGRIFTWTFNEVQFILDQKITKDLDFRFGFNQHKRTNEDLLLNLAATTVNGQGAIAQTGINKNKNDAKFPDVQAHFMWRPMADQNILVGVSKNWAYEKVNQWFQQRNPDGTPFRRVYIPADGIPRSLPADVVYIPTLHTNDPRTYTSLIVNYLGGFFGNRLHVMAGVARNKTDTKYIASDIPVRPPDFSTTDTNPQVGVIYKITPEVSVFALTSQSTQFTLTRDSFNHYFGPVTGKGGEGGLKFAFKDGRFNGTLTYYNVDQKNNVVFDPLAKSFLYQQSVSAGTPNPALLGDNVATGTTNSNGVEFELNGLIMPNWNVTFSYAHNDQTFKSDPLAIKQGTKVPALEPNKATLMTRYDLTEGEAKGLFGGGGLIYIDKVYGGFSPGSNNTKTYWAKGGYRLDIFAGYKFKAFGRAQQIKLQAIGLNEPLSTYSAGFNPAINDRYYTKGKAIYNLDYTVTF